MDALFFLREYFRVQGNLCNYLWNLKYLAYKKEILKTKASRTSCKRENNRKESVKEGKSESVKKCVEFLDVASIYRGWETQKNI